MPFTTTHRPLPGTPGRTKVRVGLVLQDRTVPAWAREMLEKIRALESVGIAVVVSTGRGSDRSGYPAPLHGGRFFRMLVKLDRMLFAPQPDAFRECGIDDLVEDVPVLQVHGEPTKQGLRLSTADVDALKAFDLDVLINIDSQRLLGEVLSASKGGVWETFIGEPGKGSNEAPSFYEVTGRHGITASGVRARRQGEDGYRILYRSSSTTDKWSMRRNNNRVMWKTSAFVSRLLKQFATTGCLPEGITAVPERPAPRDIRVVFSGLLLYAGYVWHKARGLFVTEEWTVLIRKEKTLSRSWDGFRPLAAPRGLYWTDPFLFTSGKATYLAVEEYYDLYKPAHLSFASVDEEGNVQSSVRMLERPCHVSYPFIFEWEGCLYMIPESGAERTIQLYASRPDRIEWRFVMNLMENVEAYDTTLYFDGQRWWLLTCMVETKGSGHYDELFLFSAPKFDTNDWVAHPANPVVSDVTCARPAGRLFRMNGKLYRPAQDSSKIYGYNLVLCEIKKLSEEEYVEQCEPFFEGPRPREVIAVHTLNHCNGFTVIDVMKKEWRFA